MKKAEVERIKGAAHDPTMRNVANGRKLLTGVDQGTGKHKDDTLILVGPSRTRQEQV